MLIYEDLENRILFEPARLDGKACNRLKIVTGFTDCERIATHLITLSDGIKDTKIYQGGIKIEIILGMTKGSGLTRSKHQRICSTIRRLNSQKGMPKIRCRYIVSGKQVHSKVYVWLKNAEPLAAFCGSANYSMNAFQKRRECMNDCDPSAAQNYYASLIGDSVDCFEMGIEDRLRFSDRTVATDEIEQDNIENLNYDDYADREPLDEISVSLLKAKGDVGYGSGINWGIRPNGTRRNRNQAYIPYNVKDRKAGFFPERANPGDKNCPLFKVVTREAGAFYMRLAQANDKGLHSAESNAILGKWIREKIGVGDGTFITKEMLENYGATRVRFRKYENGIYVLDFEPESSRENDELH